MFSKNNNSSRYYLTVCAEKIHNSNSFSDSFSDITYITYNYFFEKFWEEEVEGVFLNSVLN